MQIGGKTLFVNSKKFFPPKKVSVDCVKQVTSQDAKL